MNLSELIEKTKQKAETSEFNKAYYVEVLAALEKIEDLEQQLAYECGCNAQLVDLQKENQELKVKANKYDSAQRIVLSTKGIDVMMKLQSKNEKLKKAIEFVIEKINVYKNNLRSKEYEEEHLKGKYSTLGLASRNGQEKALNTVLALLKEVLGE